MLDPNRRALLQKAGLLSLLAASGQALPIRVSGAAEAPRGAGKLRRMIFRADDVGYSDIANIGTFKAVDQGVVTSLDIMFDVPGTVDVLERLRKYPWLSVGWHAHMWGTPVLGADKVPSLVGRDGHFKWSPRDGTWSALGGYNKTRQDWAPLANQVNYDEAVAEFRAQIARCVRIIGRAPDTGGGQGNTLVDKAISQVAREFGMKSGWFTKGAGGGSNEASPAAPEYRHLNVYMPSQGNGTNKHMLDVPRLGEAETYDPMAGLRSDGNGIMDKETVQLAFHPGFLDDYIATDGGIQFTMSRVRVLDVHFLCSPELRQWIKDHRIQLINQRDALNGTHEYQDHLRTIGSDLYMAA